MDTSVEWKIPEVPGYGYDPQGDGWDVSLQSDKDSYKVGQTIHFWVSIHNEGDSVEDRAGPFPGTER